MPLRTRPLLYAATALSLLPLRTYATDYYFVGPINSLFSDPLNWSTTPTGPGGFPPRNGDVAFVCPAFPLNLTLDSPPNNVTLHAALFSGSSPDNLLTVNQSSTTFSPDNFIVGPYVNFNQVGATNIATLGEISISGPDTTYSLTNQSSLHGPSVMIGGGANIQQTNSSITATNEVAIGGTLPITYSLNGYLGGEDLALDAPAAISLSQTGGTVYSESSTAIGRNTSYLLSDGTFSTSGGLSVGGISSRSNYVNSTFSSTGSTLTQTGGAILLYADFPVPSTPAFSINSIEGSTALYSLSGGTLSFPANASIVVGNTTTGTLIQSGGTIGDTSSQSNSPTTLYLGRSANATGSYSLSAGSLSSTSAILSDQGSSTFSQSGGSSSFSSFTLANSPSSSSSLTLSNGFFGVPSSTYSPNNYIAYAGSATITQTGGTLSVGDNLNHLTLASQISSSATYNLSNGLLTTPYLTIGDQGSATFTQSGGQVAVSFQLNLAGQYSQSAGSLSAEGVNLSSPSPSSPARYSLTAGTLLARYINLGPSSTLSQSAGSIYLTDGISIDSPPSSPPALYSLSNGIYSADYFDVGYTGAGTLLQSGGSISTDYTSRLGHQPGSHGSYTLSAGTLTTAYLLVGDAGSGTFTQTGGSLVLNAPSGPSLVLANAPSSNATFSLSAGSILPGPQSYFTGIVVASAGSASFSQTGGSISNIGYLTLASSPGSSAVYNLSNNGSITVQSLTVGNAGSATFNQSGGNISLTPINPYDPTDLILANAPSSSATYNLSAGSLFTQSTSLGPSGQAYLLQTGGTHSTSSLSISPSSIYDLLAGSLSAHSISNAGTFYMQPHASLTMTGSSPSFSNTGSATLDGSQSWPANSSLSNTLVTLFHSDPGSPTSSTLNFSSSSPSWAPVLFDAPTLHFASIILSSTTHATLTPTASYLYTQSLSLTDTAQLDLTTSTLLLSSFILSRPELVEGQPSSLSLDSIRQSLHDRHLISSNSDPTHSLAYAPLSLLPPTSPRSTTARSSGATDTTLLITLALTGDLNLDGQLNSDDYALLDRSFNKHPSDAHWTDGDLNYDGIINSQDYLLLDTAYAQSHPLTPAFLSQRESQFGSTYVSQLLTSLPEPSIFYPLSSLLLFKRRRES